MIYRVGDGITAPVAAGSPVFLDEYTPTGTLVQSIPLPATGSGPFLIANGTGFTEGAMSRSEDGRFLTLTGYNTAAPYTSSVSGSSATAVNRSVAIVDSTGAFRISAFSDVNSGQAVRSAVTSDGYSGWIVGGGGGVRYFAKATDTTTTSILTSPSNNRSISIWGGQLYLSTNLASTVQIGAVGAGLPTTSGQAYSGLSGYPNAGTSSGFFFADLDPGVSYAGTGFDTLYVAEEGVLPGPAGIRKWSYDGANWNLLNIVAVNGARSLTGSVSGSSVTLYTNTGSSTTATNTLVSITDTAGYGAANNGVVVTLATATGNAVFRGMQMAPVNSLLPTVLSSLTASTPTTSGPALTYTATFADPVSSLPATAFGLTFTGSVTATVGTPTGSGTTWTIPVTGITGGGTLQLNMVNSTGTAPPIVQFGSVSGSTVTVSPAGATLDVIGGQAIYASSLGTSNNVTLSVSAGNYSITDTVEPIALTPAAVLAGWKVTSAVPGNYAVSGPDAATTSLSVNLGDGADSFTLAGTNDPLAVQTAPDAAGSLAVFPTSVTIAGSLSVTGFASITQNPGVLLTADTITLSGATVGSLSTPIRTKAAVIVLTAGAGGGFVSEQDGASLSFTGGAGPLSVVNAAGLLSLDAPSDFGAGGVTLASGDGLAINAALGSPTSSGPITLRANTDGSGVDGFAMSVGGSITTASVASPAFDLTVNTSAGGVGDALLGNVTVGATGRLQVNVHAGNILSLGGQTVLSAGGGSDTFPGVIELKATGPTSAVGTSAARIPLRTGNLSVSSGSGGIFVIETSPQDVRISQAVATGTGDIDISTSSALNNGIQVVGVVTSGSGNISLRADDNLTIAATGLVGGPAFVGRIQLRANFDGSNEQSFVQEYTTAITIRTTNADPDAVVIDVSGSSETVGLAGAVLGNIKVGAGGGIVVNAGVAVGDPLSDPFRSGLIRMNHDSTTMSPSLLDVGADGSVTLTARDHPIGEQAVPILVSGGVVFAKTNSTTSTTNAKQAAGSIFVRSVGPMTVSGGTNSAANMTVNRKGSIEFSTLAGDLTLGGDVTVTTGNISLAAAGNIVQTGGGVLTEGSLSFDPAGGFATLATTFNSAGNSGIGATRTLVIDGSLTVVGAFSLDGTLAGGGVLNGSAIGTATARVSPGGIPGALTVQNISLVPGSQFIAQINGDAPGTGFDQLIVNGTVDLGGSTLAATLGYTPVTGTVHTIIENNGTLPVTGTFAGLPEGAKTSIGGTSFTVSYVGGDGNDVTLTAAGVAPPAAKVTSVIINDGVAQRSRVTKVRVNFDQPVTLANPSQAFVVVRQTPSVGSVAVNAVVDGTGTFATLTFVGGLVDGLAGKFSLQDGRYTLTVLASEFGGGGLDGNGDGTPGDDYVLNSTPFVNPAMPATGLFRLFGDANGNGRVEPEDFLAFRLAFLSNVDAFDFNGTGVVDAADFLRFRLNFLAQIV